MYQDEYLTGLGGDSNRGVTILENLLCVCYLEPFPFFFLVNLILFFNMLLTFHSKFSFLNLFTDLDGSMMAPARPD